MLRNPQCTKCVLHKTAGNHVCIAGDGPMDAQVVIIGEAPGKDEARIGKPFQGKSGQLLRAELESQGLKSVFITNTVRCRPPDNRAPEKEEIAACREYLDAELEAIKPRGIIALGAVASKAVLKKAKITQVHGQIVDVDGVASSAIYHPAYCLRDPSKLPAFRKDLNRFALHLRSEQHVATVNWSIVQKENLQKFLDDLDRCTEFSFDTETSGLDWYRANVGLEQPPLNLVEQASFSSKPVQEMAFEIRSLQLGLGFSDGSDFGWVIPMNVSGSPFPTRRLQDQIIELIVERLKGKKACAHNGKFDNSVLWSIFRLRFFLDFDTMLASHTLDENREHGLKELVRAELDEPDYDVDLATKKGQVTDLRKFYRYGALDAVYTLRLKRKFLSRLRRDSVLYKLFFKLIMPAARAFQEIDGNGLYVNLAKMAETEKDVAIKLKESMAKLNEMAAPRIINWNSPAQVSKFLYGDLKLPAVVMTDKGAPSTGEEALLAIKDKHPVADQLVKYREWEKFRSTYLDGWKEYMVGPMLYLSTKLHGTVTGRYSNRLHQVPRDGQIRSLIDAPDGWIFVQGDLSQAELRVAAIMARDVELITCYRRGLDVHWRTLMTVIGSGAVGMYNDEVFRTAAALNRRKRPRTLTDGLEIMLNAGHEACIAIWKGWKEARKKAKAVNFGFLYGMMAPKFIETAKLKYGFTPTLDEAEAMRTAFFHLYQQLPDWHKKQRRLVSLNGHVRNLAGRMRRLPGIHSQEWSLRSECERQAINAPVQGYIGDHKAMAVVEIHETFNRDKELRIVGEVHDSILMWVRPDKLDKLLPLVGDIMRTPKLVREFGINLPVPIEAEFEVGAWGSGKTWRPTA